MVQIPYTLGAGITNDPYHLPIVSVQLTRNINNLAPELKDEMKAAFEDAVVVEGEGIFHVITFSNASLIHEDAHRMDERTSTRYHDACYMQNQQPRLCRTSFV